MKQYASSLKHALKVVYFAIEDGTPAKQQRTLSDNKVFRNRDTEGIEAPTLDPMIVTVGIRPAMV